MVIVNEYLSGETLFNVHCKIFFSGHCKHWSWRIRLGSGLVTTILQDLYSSYSN